MRNLNNEELNQVYGSGDTCERQKGNNGWGNGSENAFPPGNSGFTAFNSQLSSKLTDAER